MEKNTSNMNAQMQMQKMQIVSNFILLAFLNCAVKYIPQLLIFIVYMYLYAISASYQCFDKYYGYILSTYETDLVVGQTRS